MAKKISKAGVGAFVVCGIILLVLGIIALGGKSMLRHNVEYSLYFNGSVNGLSIGAPVVFRGVPMGNVTKISLIPNRKEGHGVLIAVNIRISPNAFGWHKDGHMPKNVQSNILKRMVKNGLRARLLPNSIITGQYRVDLDMFPGDEPVYYSNTPEQEIPTVLSPLDNLTKSLQELPLAEMAHELRSTLKKISELLNSGDLDASIKNLRATLEDTASIADNLESHLSTASKDMSTTMQTFRTTMVSMDTAMRNVGAALDRNSPTMRKFQQAMQDFSAASRAMRELAETLERNPEALLRGKGSKR